MELGGATQAESLLLDPVVKAVAESTGKTPAQVLLRWAVQRGTAVIPKSQNADRIAENLDIFSFTLSEE